MAMARFDFGDAAALIGFLGVLHKIYKGYTGYGFSGDSSRGDSSRQAFAGDQVYSASAMESVKRKLLSKPVVQKIRDVKSPERRVAFIREMIERYGNDPDVRKVTGDLLTGRMDVWGRVRNDGQFHAFRQHMLRSTGEPWAVKEKDWPREVQQIFQFNRNMVRYTRDPSTRDTYTSPTRTFAYYNIGDCDCYTILAGAMLKSVGYPMKIRIIRIHGQPTYGHIYLVVGMPPTGPVKWYPFDASIQKPVGTQAPRAMIAQFKDFSVG